MTPEDVIAKVERFEAEAASLHTRSRLASSRLEATVLRFRALWKEEAVRLLRRNMG